MAADDTSSDDSSSSSSSSESESENRDCYHYVRSIHDRDLFNSGVTNAQPANSSNQLSIKLKVSETSSDDSSDEDIIGPVYPTVSKGKPLSARKQFNGETTPDITEFQPSKRKAATMAQERMMSLDASCEDDSDADATYKFKKKKKHFGKYSRDYTQRVRQRRRDNSVCLENILANQPRVVLTCVLVRLNQLRSASAKDTAVKDQTKTSPPPIQETVKPAIPVQTVTPLNNSNLMFNCGECDAKVMRESDLLRHRELHRVKSTHQCLKCSFSTPHQWQMVNHMTYDHVQAVKSDVQPVPAVVDKDGVYSCNICEFSSDTNEVLKKHLYHHTRRLTIKCLHCTYSASSNWLIKEHVKTGHMSLSKDQKDVLLSTCHRQMSSHTTVKQSKPDTATDTSSNSEQKTKLCHTNDTTLLEKKLKRQQTEIDQMKKQLQQFQQINKQKVLESLTGCQRK